MEGRYDNDGGPVVAARAVAATAAERAGAATEAATEAAMGVS